MPKRNLLRVLAEYANSDSEKNELMGLCSIKGTAEKVEGDRQRQEGRRRARKERVVEG
jgi:hypothetical protein